MGYANSMAWRVTETIAGLWTSYHAAGFLDAKWDEGDPQQVGLDHLKHDGASYWLEADASGSTLRMSR